MAFARVAACVAARIPGRPAASAAEWFIRVVLADVQDELLAPLSPGDRQALTGMLTRVLDHHAGSQTRTRPGGPAGIRDRITPSDKPGRR